MRFLITSLFFSGVAMGAPVSFTKQIVPILADQCLECHRVEKAKGSYRLDTFEELLKAGDSDELPLVPGKAEESELYKLLVVHDEGDRMPKKADPLPEKDIALIRQWINEGAQYDSTDQQVIITSLLEKKKIESPKSYPMPLPVTALAVNGDGKVLVSSGYHEVLSWDPSTGTLRGRIPDMPERILGLSFVRGGPWLVVAGGVPGRSGEVWLVNFTKPSERKLLMQMRDCALSAATSADGKYLVTGGADNRVRCFGLPEGNELWSIEAHADWILSVAISRDGQHIATASRDRTAKVFKTATGEIEGTFNAHSSQVLSVAFSPNGQEVMSGDLDGETRRWTLNGVNKKDTTLRPHQKAGVLAVAYLDANTPLIASTSGQVSVIDGVARKTKMKLTNHQGRATALTFFGSADTLTAISGGHHGEVHVVRVSDASILTKFIASPGWPREVGVAEATEMKSK